MPRGYSGCERVQGATMRQYPGAIHPPCSRCGVCLVRGRDFGYRLCRFVEPGSSGALSVTQLQSGDGIWRQRLWRAKGRHDRLGPCAVPCRAGAAVGDPDHGTCAAYGPGYGWKVVTNPAMVSRLWRRLTPLLKPPGLCRVNGVGPVGPDFCRLPIDGCLVD